jgi:septum site-determining protein MinC
LPRADRSQPEAVVDIRYGQVGLVQVRVHTTNPGAILDELTGRVATAPHFFRRTGVCLDLSPLEHTPEVPEVQGVVDVLRRAGMLTVGLSGDADALAAASAALGLPVLTSFRPPARAVPVVQPAVPAAFPASMPAEPAGGAASALPGQGAAEPGRLCAAAAAASMLGTNGLAGRAATGITIAPQGAFASSVAVAQDALATAVVPAAAVMAGVGEGSGGGQPALIHSQTVRSGQRIYGRDRDLIVTASVGAGAEVMADGCVHIYGALRGRVMAGTHGQPGARVFCQQFYAELVSIAGIFRVFETIPPELAGAPVQAWLVGEELRFARIG